MKKVWRTIFFVDRPAAGAWFGLSLFAVGSYLTWVTALLLWGKGWIEFDLKLSILSEYGVDPVDYWINGILVILGLLYLSYLLRFYRGLLRSHRTPGQRLYGWDLAGLIGLIAAAGLLSRAWYWTLGAGLLVFTWYCLLYVCGCIRRKSIPAALASILCEAVGLAGGILCLQHVSGTLENWYRIAAYPSHPIRHVPDLIFSAMADGLGIAGAGWSLTVMLTVTALAAAWWLRLRVWARLNGQPFGTLWSRRTAVLWIVALAVYAAGLLLAWHADYELRGLEQRLEARYGHSLRAGGLAKLYRPGETPDPEYWRRLGELEQTLSQRFRPVIPDSGSTTRNWDWTPEQQAEIRKQFQESVPEWTEMEAMLDGPIPKYPLEFPPDRLLYLEMPYGMNIYRLAHLELVRLNLALEMQDRETALTIYHRLDKLSRSFRHEIGSGQFLFLGLVQKQLDGLELLIASGLYDDVELRQLTDEVAALEKVIPAGARLFLSTDVIFSAATAEAFLSGQLWSQASNLPFALVPPMRIRYATPYLWWLLRHDEIRLLRLYDRDALADFEWDGSCLCTAPGDFLSVHLSNTVMNGTISFQNAIDRCRAERLLIDQERYRRNYGEYPAKPDFALKPLNPNHRFIREFGPAQKTFGMPGVKSPFENNSDAQEPKPWLLCIRSERWSGKAGRAAIRVKPGAGPVTMTLQCLLETLLPRTPDDWYESESYRPQTSDFHVWRPSLAAKLTETVLFLQDGYLPPSFFLWRVVEP